MKVSSIIISGVFATVLLIFSCISLNAARYYSELGFNDEISLTLKPTIVLRDRTSLLEHSEFMKKEIK